jgi:hypothetical protein
MTDQELVEEIVNSAIDKIWLPFEFRFIDWEDDYKKKFLRLQERTYDPKTMFPEVVSYKYGGYTWNLVPLTENDLISKL